MALEVGLNTLLLIAAYLFGSIPTGYWVTYHLKNIDIRHYGSGSTGATNVLRVVGKGAGLFVLCADVCKAIAAISLVRGVYYLGDLYHLFPPGIDLDIWKPWIMTLAGLAALFGHSNSLWLILGPGRDPNLANGGKAVASSLGVLLALSWQVGLATLGIFITIIALSRIVSLSSMLSAIAISVLMIGTHQPLPFCLFAIAATAYVLIRHRANIDRLLDGTEPRLGQQVQASD
ncbi:glycerol-3-phosphate 1-O-acyltransferase PlsY [Phormidium yuhuli AB48]|uniref:Glycerol-3-phosphate acyltransferase n=1 Tax=Phormidium yuhuli AB48 TaxID=2940671 RepID=A0ABY5AM35_9CYAN|nr:glycerol-3-phosphate 1-O-acyltransferase PlsY [Phormidium yuhuli]USR90267.1 glycerol-3-phosphate 1-O-acyltransferase PlsY [Phormidium yuhuli AB48]